MKKRTKRSDTVQPSDDARIMARLLKALGSTDKVKAAAEKQQDGKSIVVGEGESTKDVWDF